jgi:hypothetical protein
MIQCWIFFLDFLPFNDENPLYCEKREKGKHIFFAEGNCVIGSLFGQFQWKN